MIQNPTKYTGEGFPSEKTLAYLSLFISLSILTVMALEAYRNHKQRKLDMELSRAQLNEIKNGNGNSKL